MESNDTKFAHFLSTLVSHAWKSYGYPAFGKVKDCSYGPCIWIERQAVNIDINENFNDC